MNVCACECEIKLRKDSKSGYRVFAVWENDIKKFGLEGCLKSLGLKL
jgi:hypothetical protein